MLNLKLKQTSKSMTQQKELLISLKMSIKEFIHQINHLLSTNKNNPAQINDACFDRFTRIIHDIHEHSQELYISAQNKELQMNTKLIQGFIHQEFYINKENTQKASLISLKNIQQNPAKTLQQILSYWNHEKNIAEVLFDDLYNIVHDLAI